MGVEGGNFYEDQIIRDQNVVERQEERDAIDERLERSEVSRETQGGIESVQADIERQEEVIKMLERFESLSEKKNINGYDVFENFLLSESNEIQEQFLDRTNARNLKQVVEKSGRFPVNEFEFQQSLIEGAILKQIEETESQAEETESQAEETESQAEETESQADKRTPELIEIGNRFIWMSNLESIISLIPNFSEYKKLIKKGDFTQKEADFITLVHEQILSEIKAGNYLETNILSEAYNLWEQEYRRVKELLFDLHDDEIQSRILAWEMTPSFAELPAEQMVRVSGALGTRIDEVGDIAEQSGNIFTLTGTDGVQIDYDVVADERSLELDGYTIQSQVEDLGDYQTPKLKYMRVEQAHLPKLQQLSAAGEMLEQAQVSDDNITEIKDILKGEEALGYSYYVELGIVEMQTAQEIKELLQKEFTEHNTALEDAREEYRDELLRLRNGHMAALEQKDRRIKQTLRFLESIGFTQIPQYISDQIIDTLNSNSGLRAQLGFTEKIDFANGQIGMDRNSGESEEIDLLDQVAFAEFVNRMIGVNAINIEALKNGTGAPVGDRNKFRTLLRESGLMDVGGVGVAMENLKKAQ